MTGQEHEEDTGSGERRMDGVRLSWSGRKIFEEEFLRPFEKRLLGLILGRGVEALVMKRVEG